MKMNERRKGFTLAEVLITLGIIGVVAALTIPTLMANYQKVQEVAGLKKAYAEITEALRLMANDAGCPDDLACVMANIPTVGDDWTFLGIKLKQYLKVAKDCGNNSDSAAADFSYECLSDNVRSNIDGTGDTDDMNLWTGYDILTSDGFGINIYTYDWVANYHTGPMSIVYGEINIDINGRKGPNIIGRDVFSFYITNGKGIALYPFGGADNGIAGTAWSDSSGTAKYCTSGSPDSLDGWECAGRIMEQGWQMLY